MVNSDKYIGMSKVGKVKVGIIIEKDDKILLFKENRSVISPI